MLASHVRSTLRFNWAHRHGRSIGLVYSRRPPGEVRVQPLDKKDFIYLRFPSPLIFFFQNILASLM